MSSWWRSSKFSFILRRDNLENWQKAGMILQENEVAVIDLSDDTKITVIGNGKTKAVNCPEINFPYTEIVWENHALHFYRCV